MKQSNFIRIILVICLLFTVTFTLYTSFLNKDDPYKPFHKAVLQETNQPKEIGQPLPQEVVKKICPATTQPNSTNESFIQTSIMSIENGDISLSSIINDGKDFKLKEGMIFDVMNEYGYITQACISQANYSSYEFELTSISGTTKTSIVPKLSQIKSSYINIFLVYPSDPKRKNISIEIDKPTNNNLSDFYYTERTSEKIFNTLPKKVQNWHWLFKERYEIETSDEDKESIKKWLETYTDLDGDGVIDLVSVEGPCDSTSKDDLSCSKILCKINGIWKEVYFQTPA